MMWIIKYMLCGFKAYAMFRLISPTLLFIPINPHYHIVAIFM